MAVKTILPTTNLEYSDVRDTLNANGGSVNNNMASLYSESAKINRWSKYKPVTYYKDFPEFEEDWWKGDDKKCGLNIMDTSVDGEIINIYNSGNAYTYVPVSNNKYRLGDFRGYFPKAEPYIRTNVSKDTIFEWDFNNNGPKTLPIQVVRASDTSLTINDVKLPLDINKLKIAVTRYNENPLENPGTLQGDTEYFDITTTFPFIELGGLRNNYNIQYFLLYLTDASGFTPEVPLPYDDNNSFLIKVKNIASVVIIGSISQFALFSTKVWSNVEDYLSTPYNSKGGSSETVLFKSSIKNVSTSSITFAGQGSSVTASHSIKIYAEGEISNGEYKKIEIDCNLYNGFSGTLDYITIPSKNTKEVIFGTSKGLFNEFYISGKSNLITIRAVIVNVNTKTEATISSIRILIN